MALISSSAATPSQRIATLPPMHAAIVDGKLDSLRKLLDQGVSATSHFLDKETNRAFSPLILAISLGKQECLEELLTNPNSAPNVSLAERVRGLGNVLHVAADYKQSGIITFLFRDYLKKSYSLLKQKNEAGRTPLMLAAEKGDLLSIQEFLKRTTKILADKDQSGKTALHLAAENGHEEVCKKLISLGARADAEDDSFQRPFDLAKNPVLKQQLRDEYTKLREYESSPPNFHRYPPLFVSYKGGGAKGAVHLGVSEVLVEKQVNYSRVSGTSTGAIKGTFDALNIKSERERELFNNTSFKKFKDLTISGKGGIFKGAEFSKWISDVILEVTGKENFTFGDLRRKVKEGTGYRHLYIYAVRIKPTCELVCFNSESKEWDNLPLAEAVRASMSIPFAFEVYRLNFKDDKGKLYSDPDKCDYVDGGMLKNLPLDNFDSWRYTRPGSSKPEHPEFNKRLLAFNICSPDDAEEKDARVANNARIYDLFTLANDLLKVYFQSEILQRKKINYNSYRIVNIPSCGIDTMNFDLTLPEKDMLMKAGREATEAFFAKEKLLALLDDGERALAEEHYASEKKHILAYLHTPDFFSQLIGYPNRKRYIQFLMEKLADETGKETSVLDFSKFTFPKAFLEEVLMCSKKCLTIFLESKAISPLMLLSYLLDQLHGGKYKEANSLCSDYGEYFKDLFRSDERGFKEDYSQEAVEKLFSCNKKEYIQFFIENGLIPIYRCFFAYHERNCFQAAEKFYARYKNYFLECTHASFFKKIFGNLTLSTLFTEKGVPFFVLEDCLIRKDGGGVRKAIKTHRDHFIALADSEQFIETLLTHKNKHCLQFLIQQRILDPFCWYRAPKPARDRNPEMTRRVVLHHLNTGNQKEAEIIFARYKSSFRMMPKSEILKMSRKQLDFFISQKVLDPVICSQAGVYPVSSSLKDLDTSIKTLISEFEAAGNQTKKNLWFNNYENFFKEFMGSSLLKAIHEKRNLVAFLIGKKVIDRSSFLYCLLDLLSADEKFEVVEESANQLYQSIFNYFKDGFSPVQEQLEEVLAAYDNPNCTQFFLKKN